MNKLVYIYVPNEFVIGYVLLTLLIKRLAVAMVNKTVDGRCICLMVNDAPSMCKPIKPSMYPH
jgi:hypothetical protein